MNVNSLVAAAISLPAVSRLQLPPEQGGQNKTPSQIEAALREHVPSVVAVVGTGYVWDFAMREDSSLSIISGQDKYVCKGIEVAGVWIGDDRLKKLTIPGYNYMLETGEPTTATYWIPWSRSTSGAPIIKIVATPGASGGVIRYSYWRDDLTVDSFPPFAHKALIYELGSRMAPGYSTYAKAALSEAIKAVERGGEDVEIMRMDRNVRDRNVERNRLHGWS